MQDPQPGRVAGGDLAAVVQGDDGVRHRLQHRLVVVLHVVHVGEQLGVLQGDRNLRREGAQPRFVLVGERPAVLVQNLGDADGLAVFVDDRHAQDRAREEPGLLVERRIEAQVGVGIGYVDRLAGGEHGAGDAEVVGEANLHRLQPLPHFGPKFVGLVVVKEQGRALGVEHARRFAHHLLQQRAELDVRGHLRHHVDKLHLLLAHRLHALDEHRALQGQRALGGHRLKHGEIALGEAALLLVQGLRHADDVALHRPDRGAQDVARDESRLLVDRAVEVRVRIGVLDQHRFAGSEHVSGYAAGVQNADLVLDISLGDARIQFVGLRVVEEQRSALGIQFRRGHLDQHPQHVVQRVVRRHPARHLEQQLDQLQPPANRGIRPLFRRLAPAAQARDFGCRFGLFHGSYFVRLAGVACNWSRSSRSVACSCTISA